MSNSTPSQRGATRILSVVFTALLVFFVFLLGIWVGGHPRQTGLDRLPGAISDRLIDEDRTALSTQVLAILQQDYYKPIDPTVVSRIEDLSVEALVTALKDPYTEYLNPVEYSEFKNARAGVFGGVGIEFALVDESAIIKRVTPGGPAAKAGLLANDRIVAVNGKPVVKSDEYAAMQSVRGEIGTPVTLRVARAELAERDYTMTREEIRERIVEGRIESVGKERVGYVRLNRFTTGAGKAFSTEVRRLVNDQKATRLVFDLRRDPGGLVSEAVDIASVFLPKDATIAKTTERRGDGQTLMAKGGAISPNVPVVLLVDENSASASEIVAGALRDSGRARLVGTRTFGKALIQTTRTLPNGGAIKFTSASYLTPKGFDLGTTGLPPDVQVSDDPATAVDEALQKALAEVTSR